MYKKPPRKSPPYPTPQPPAIQAEQFQQIWKGFLECTKFHIHFNIRD